jgi:lysine-N-methylase
MSRRPWDRRRRLAQRADGACVFLDERGLCRIHAKFGEAAKPLACRIYPFAFHPAGRQVVVGLRYSCPSAVANRGKPVVQRAAELREIADLVVPAGVERLPPPRVSPGQRVEWSDFLAFVHALERLLAEPDASIAVKWCRATTWIDLVSQARFEKIRGARLDEFLALVSEAARAEWPQRTIAELPPGDAPPPLAVQQFRLAAAFYARKDTEADRAQGWRSRWRLLRAAWKFARGTGATPVLRDDLPPVPFDALERPFGAWPSEVEEILTRYFQVKVHGLHFCGPAFYGFDFVQGARSLALVLPVVAYLARWFAAAEGRASLSTEDVSRALAVADHNHGYSESLGGWNARRRLQLLAGLDAFHPLIRWYAR